VRVKSVRILCSTSSRHLVVGRRFCASRRGERRSPQGRTPFGPTCWLRLCRAVALGAFFFPCREERIHHRAHRDHREKCFCSREQRLQDHGSLLVDPQSLPASLLRDLCGPAGAGRNPSWVAAGDGWRGCRVPSSLFRLTMTLLPVILSAAKNPGIFSRFRSSQMRGFFVRRGGLRMTDRWVIVYE
jgi:hypothetical protein